MAKDCAKDHNQNDYRHKECENDYSKNGKTKRWVQFYGPGCQGANFCKFKGTSAMGGGGDPCNRSHKHAEIVYHCEKTGNRVTKQVNEYHDIQDSTGGDVKCPAGKLIHVHHPVVFESVHCENPLDQGRAWEAVNQE